jgi:hypothetical protein
MRRIAPFVSGCQDKNFVVDGEKRAFPEVLAFVPYIIHLALSGRHKGVWRFNPSTLYGVPRPAPGPASAISSKTSLTTPISPPNGESLLLPMILGTMFIIVLYLLLV